MEYRPWWNRDLPGWGESLFWGALFAAGVAYLVWTGLMPPSWVTPLIETWFPLAVFVVTYGVFVWFFSPMYVIRNQHLSEQPELVGPEARALQRARRLAVGQSVAVVALVLSLASPFAGISALAFFNFGMMLWAELATLGMFLLAAAWWGTLTIGPMTRVCPLWRLRLTGRDDPLLQPDHGACGPPNRRAIGAVLGIAVLLIAIAPVVVSTGIEARSSAKTLGRTRAFEAGATVELLNGVRFVVPPTWRATVTTGGSMHEMTGVMQSAALSSDHAGELVFIDALTDDSERFTDPLRLAEEIARKGTWGSAVETAHTRGWSGPAFMWETAPNTWKTSAPERSLKAKLRGPAGQTISISLSSNTSRQLEPTASPSAVTETIIRLLQLTPVSD